MEREKSCTCYNKYFVSKVVQFLDLSDTLASKPCRDHWNGLDQNAKRKIQIQDGEFEGAYKISVIKDDAYKFFTDALDTQEPLACQSIFPSYNGNKADVYLWMKDMGAA